MTSESFSMKMMNHITLFLLLIALSFKISFCDIEEINSAVLGVEENTVLDDSNSENLFHVGVHYSLQDKPLDCADWYRRGYQTNGVYTIWPVKSYTSFGLMRLLVYCDMTTRGGGWTVIQRRGDFERDNFYFNKNWHEYKMGFGSLSKDFWLGNENIHILTKQRVNSVLFDMEFESGEKVYAEYDKFIVGNESTNYMLHIKDYSGTAGNSMKGLDNKQFSTKDRDNDVWPESCALRYSCGWWFDECGDANLNGRYNNGTDGMWWMYMGAWKSVKTAEIKIRPIYS